MDKYTDNPPLDDVDLEEGGINNNEVIDNLKLLNLLMILLLFW